jgi:predicted methyltransferase
MMVVAHSNRRVSNHTYEEMNMNRTWSAIGVWSTALATALMLAACASVEKVVPTPDAAQRAAVAAPDRSDADRKLDARRKPAELLAFTGVQPGMRILDIGAGSGYSTELLARVAGPAAQVWGQNDPGMMEKYVKTSFDDRAAAFKGARLMKHVSTFENPVPPGAAPLDLVTIYLFYHDIAYLPVDRARMLANLNAAMKPGALLVITDHAANPGEGVKVAQTLHRIEEATVRTEVEAAGFKLVAESDAWRNPEDKHTEPFFKMKTPTDQFALKFIKR